MAEQNIGAARVHLIVDASDFDSGINQARNTASAFGRDAEAAFNKSSDGVRRATARIADYIAALKSADGPMERQLRQLARLGADESIIKALASAWTNVRSEIQQTADAMEEAQRINAAFNQQREANSQRDFNALLGVDSQRSGAYLAEQQRVVGALTQQFKQVDAAIDQAFAQDADIERFRQQLVNLQETAGKTHYELLQLRADRLGVGETFRPMIKAIQDQDKAMGHAGITAKQYEWAMRGLPAQITDIAVSLASGQPAYLVMLQQGGQLKDMFGGIGPAARAVGSAVLRMVNPWTIAAAAVAGFAVAAHSAESDIHSLNTAIAQSGNYARTSVGQLQAYIAELNAIEGVSAGTAREAITAAVGSGAFNQDQFEAVAEAAARMEAAVGQSIDTTIQKFQRISKDPVNALMALNDAEHFLTQAQIDRIFQLTEEGKQQEAVAEAIKLYADALNNVANTATSTTPHLTKMWRDVKDAVGDAWEYAKGFADFLVGAAQKARKDGGLWNMLPGGAAFNYVKALYTLEPPEPPAPVAPAGTVVDPQEQKEKAAALAQWSATADKAAQRQLTLNKLEAEGVRLGQDRAAIDAVLARQRKQWAEQDAKSAARGQGGGRDGTQAIRDQAAAEIAAITTQTKLLQSQYDQRQITVEDYYKKLRGYADQELAVTLRSIDAQKAAVAGQKDGVTRIAELESQAARAREQNQQRNIELSEAERKAIQQREIAYRDYVRALDDANKAAQRSADLEVARIGMGSVQYNRLVAINEVMRKRAELEDELNRRVADGNLNPADAQRYRDALEKVNEQINIMVDGYKRVDEAQQSFFLGAQGAWQDWLEQTRDVAGQGRELMTSALEGFSSATADALNGNLKSFDNFFENLHIQILNFIVRQQLTKWLESLGEAASKAEGDGLFGRVLRGLGSLLGGGKKADTGAAALTASAAALTGAATALTSAAVALGGAGVANGASTGGGGALMSIFSMFTKNAKGNVYGGETLAAYRNSIVSQPTVFPFAKGGAPRWGLMGEAGKEGIFPLARTASGDLGVRVVESRQSRGPTHIRQQFIVQGTPDRSTREQMAKKAGRETSRAMART